MQAYEHLIGNPRAKKLLTALADQGLNSRLLIFYGIDGVGKTSFAKRFAQVLLSRGASTEQQAKIEGDSHPDLVHLEVEGKGEVYSMATIKRFIEDQSLPPFEAGCKVYLFHDAEAMLTAHYNALLKTIEEPSDTSVIIFVMNEIDRIIPTIRSRAIEIPFYPIEEELLAPYFEKEWGLKEAEAKRIAVACDGSLALAREMLDQSHQEVMDQIASLIKQTYIRNWPYVYEALEVLESQKVSPNTIFSSLAYWFRDMHLVRAKGDLDLLYYRGYVSDLKQCLLSKVPSLDMVDQMISNALLGVQRHGKLSRSTEYALLKLVP
ncbi:MAG: hypothetical protein S4CHLAM102_00290 [Chlamydiia bacterium]|nr:hypothetical protein [Chlamydiia bacterium]